MLKELIYKLEENEYYIYNVRYTLNYTFGLINYIKVKFLYP